MLDKLEQEIKNELQINKMKNRGVSSKTMTTDLRLLLTLNYLRHYPTFSSLGSVFGISESYANKIFRITKDVYRGKHKNHGKIWNLVAGLVNLRYEKSLV